jgi:PAS domain S-box-containing protein
MMKLSSEETLKSIIKVAPAGIGITLNRVLQEVNDRICEMTGYEREELIGQDARMLYPDDEEYQFVGREKYNQIARQGSGSVETRWKRKDGEIIYVMLASTPIDETNLNSGVVFTALDFTEKKQMQEALKQSELRFRTLAETAPAGIVISDVNERVLYINQRFTKMFGYTAEQITSVYKWYALAYPDKQYRERVQKEWEASISSQINGKKTNQGLEYSVTCSDGSMKQIEFRLTRLGEHNFIFFIDHTERHKAEVAIRESERRHKAELENEVKSKTQELRERIRELERFHQATIDREFRIKELRDEIERLKSERL